MIMFSNFLSFPLNWLSNCFPTNRKPQRIVSWNRLVVEQVVKVEQVFLCGAAWESHYKSSHTHFTHSLTHTANTHSTHTPRNCSCCSVLRGRCEQGARDKGQFGGYQMPDTLVCGRFRWGRLLAYRSGWELLSGHRIWCDPTATTTSSTLHSS